MKKTFIFLVIFLPLLLNAQTSWVRWWPQPQAASVWPNNIVKTYDGGYAFHWTYYFHDQFDEYYEDRLFKTDSLGNLLWEQQWSANLSVPELNTLNQMPDSSYLWAGRYIVKVTPEGQIAWSIDVDTLIAPGAEIYTSILTPDGNVVFVAYKRNSLGDDWWWLLKMNTHGQLLWVQPHQFEFIPKIIELLYDSLLVILAPISNFWQTEFILAIFDHDGNFLISKPFQNTETGDGTSLYIENDENLLMGTYNGYLYRLNLSLQIVWQTVLDSNYTSRDIRSIRKSNNKNIVFVTGQKIYEIFPTGNIHWCNSLPGATLFDEKTYYRNLIKERDGYVVGLKRNNREIGIAKTDTMGIIVRIAQLITIPETILLFQNYPNPFNASTTIYFQLSKPDKIELVIYNVLGEIVEILINQHFAIGRNHVSWNSDRFASGLYFYQLRTSNKSITKKMLLIK